MKAFASILSMTNRLWPSLRPPPPPPPPLPSTSHFTDWFPFLDDLDLDPVHKLREGFDLIQQSSDSATSLRTAEAIVSRRRFSRVSFVSSWCGLDCPVLPFGFLVDPSLPPWWSLFWVVFEAVTTYDTIARTHVKNTLAAWSGMSYDRTQVRGLSVFHFYLGIEFRCIGIVDSFLSRICIFIISSRIFTTDNVRYSIKGLVYIN